MKGLDQKTLTILRAKLEDARDETKRLIDQYENGSEAEDPGELLGDSLASNQADRGTDLYFREQSLGLAQDKQAQLEDIEHALAKMDNGTYGVSEGNGEPIPVGRLKARPWARYTVEEEEARSPA